MPVVSFCQAPAPVTAGLAVPAGSRNAKFGAPSSVNRCVTARGAGMALAIGRLRSASPHARRFVVVDGVGRLADVVEEATELAVVGAEACMPLPLEHAATPRTAVTNKAPPACALLPTRSV